MLGPPWGAVLGAAANLPVFRPSLRPWRPPRLGPAPWVVGRTFSFPFEVGLHSLPYDVRLGQDLHSSGSCHSLACFRARGLLPTHCKLTQARQDEYCKPQWLTAHHNLATVQSASGATQGGSSISIRADKCNAYTQHGHRRSGTKAYTQ